jgi:hypothetical protein
MDKIEFSPTDQVHTHLPGEKGTFPGIVMFSFTSPYDAGVYYIIRMDQTVRDKAGRPWETFEVRSRWQISRNEDTLPPFTENRDKLDALTSRTNRAYVSDAEANFAALDPAAAIARSEDEEEDEDR